jgi:pSer/pThr/pTyr-binding forkhead associated (FHA) protein
VPSPDQIQKRLEAERAGTPFMVANGRIVTLNGDRLSIGRAESNAIALPEDTEVSRLHAELECIAGEWTVVDDGLSRNGTFVNGTRVSGRTRLRDGDYVRVGRTELQFRRPVAEETREATVVAGELPAVEVTPGQRAVLVALARPFKHAELGTPATNQDIAGQLYLSVDAVKAHLRALFGRFGIEHLPQNQKRAALVAEALQRGVISRRDL